MLDMAQRLLRRTALNESKIEYVDLNLNPVQGCQHACTYCYARLIDLRFGKVKSKGEWHRPREFGNFMQLLEAELSQGKFSKEHEIFISTMTDVYQDFCAERGIGRRIIELIKEYRYTFRLLTKSPNVLQDKDILAYEQGLVGLSITTDPDNDSARKKWEPRAAPIQERLDVMEELSEVDGMKLWVSAEPFLPGTDFGRYFEAIFEHGGERLAELVVGKMNYVAGVDSEFDWEDVVRIIEEFAAKYHPGVRFHYKKEFTNFLEKRGQSPAQLGLISEEEFAERQLLRTWVVADAARPRIRSE